MRRLVSHISDEWFVNESFYFQKDIHGRNGLNRTDNTPCQKLAAKIKAFQSAFEIKGLATNGTCRQVTLMTYIDALLTRCLLYLTVCLEDSQHACLKRLIFERIHTCTNKVKNEFEFNKLWSLILICILRT